MAFLSTPGIERLYSAVTNNRPRAYTVHFEIIRMFGSQGTFRGAPRLRVLKPLIFRLTPRGLDRLCVFTDNTDAISTTTLLSQDFRCSGGNSDGGGETALEDTHRMDVRQILGGLSGAARRFKAGEDKA